MIAPARRAALQVLQTVETGRADLPAALARSRQQLPDDRDRALAAQLAIGALRWQNQLDHVIAAASNRPLTRLDRDVLVILRLGSYQLLHLDRVPAAAVVDDAVEQTRRSGKSSAAGFVNAVLRAVARSRHRLPLPPRPTLPLSTPEARLAALDYLSISLSHPRWLVERWLDRWGFERVEAWLQFNNAEAPLTIRANTLQASRETVTAQLAARGVVVQPTTWAPDGLVPTEGNPLRTGLLEAGLFLVQDEASQLVPLLANIEAGERVLDACAAPGGKTAALAAAAGGEATIVGADLRPKRIALLRETLERCRIPASIVRIDVEHALPFGPVFDVAVLDAPCSGLGTIRRDPEIRWRRRVEQLEAFAAAQQRMLQNVAAVVRPGGRLIYATCSSEIEENEQVVARFLAQEPRFRARSAGEVRRALPDSVAPVINEDGHLRTWPFDHGLEAFFAAVLVHHEGPLR